MSKFLAYNLGVLATLGFLTMVYVRPVEAASSCSPTIGTSGEAAIAEYIPGPESLYTLEQPFGGVSQVKNIGSYIQTVYQFSLGIIGIMAVVLIMFGGLRWVAAAGNESVIGEAKEIISSAVIGLVIALLSYVILLFINPQLTNTSVNVFKIPIPSQCEFAKPETVPIKTLTGLLGNGHTLCASAEAELERIANYMQDGGDGPGGQPGTCVGCRIGVSSGMRDSERQAKLYACYQQAVQNGVKDGSSCPAGCSSCNPACPVCTSNHEKGTAVDVWLENYNAPGAAASSEGKLKASYNPGAVKSTPDLVLNQNKLKEVMERTPNSKFKGIGNEWWHFDFKGTCGAPPPKPCKVVTVNGQSVADHTYCINDAHGGGFVAEDPTYSYANCAADGTASCDPANGRPVYVSTCGGTASTHLEFDPAKTFSGGTKSKSIPVCTANP